MKNYENVRIEKARKVALDSLNSQLENASTGLTSVINEAKEKIKDENATVTSINDKLEETLGIIEDVTEAKENAEQLLDIYEASIEETTLSSSYKGIVTNNINKAREELDKVKSLLNEENKNNVEEILNNFKTTLTDNRYKEVAEIAESKILQASKDMAKAKINEYAKYEYVDISTLIEEAIEAIDEQEKVDDVNRKKEDYLAKLKEEVAEIEANIEEGKKKYAVAYKNAIEVLNEYELCLKEVITDDAQKEDIQKIIDNTKTKITKVETSGEVEYALNTLSTYIGEYYQELNEAVGNFAFENARKEAIEELNEYVTENKESETIKRIVEQAITQMNAIETDSENATASKIKEIKDDAIAKVEAQELTEAKAEATKRLTKYNELAKGKEKEADVKEKINKELKNIQNATDKKQLNEKVNRVIDEIIELLGIQSEKEKADEERVKILDTIQEKINLSKETGDTNLEKELKSIISAINEAKTTEELEKLAGDYENYVNTHYQLLNEKDDTIKNLNKGKYNDTEEDSTITYPNDNVIKNYIDSAISKIKKAENSDKIGEIIGQLKEDIKERTELITDFEEIKADAEELLSNEETQEGNAFEESTFSQIEEYKNWDNVVKQLVENAKKDIEKINFDNINKGLSEDEKEEKYKDAFEEVLNTLTNNIDQYVTQEKNEAFEEIDGYTGIIKPSEFNKGLDLSATETILEEAIGNAKQQYEGEWAENKESIISLAPAMMLMSEEITTIEQAKNEEQLEDVVNDAKVAVEKEIAKQCIENIKNSKLYNTIPTGQNKNAYDSLMNKCKTKIENETEDENGKITPQIIKTKLEEQKSELSKIYVFATIDNFNSNNQVGISAASSRTYQEFEKNIKLTSTGLISGQLKKITNFGGFNSVNGGNSENGYYLALEVINAEDVKNIEANIIVNGVKTENNVIKGESDESKNKGKGYIIARIPSSNINETAIAGPISLEIKIKDENGNVLTDAMYDLSKLTLANT